MKKWVIFAIVTFILIAVILVIFNFSAIVGALLKFPIDWLIAYALGAGTMYGASIFEK